MTAPTTEQPATDQMPPFDPTNPHLNEATSSLSVAVVPTNMGSRLALTIRHPSGSCTVFLPRDNATEWAQLITQAAQQMSGLIVPGLGTPLPNPAG